jgi:hypothetical protein
MTHSPSIAEHAPPQQDDMGLENTIDETPFTSTLEPGYPQDLGNSNSPLPRRRSVDASTFGERRRRAAKLTRFFGVSYHSSINAGPNSSSVPAEPCKQSTPREVDVKVSSRTGFWRFSVGQSQLKNADVADVMERLRTLKAA